MSNRDGTEGENHTSVYQSDSQGGFPNLDSFMRVPDATWWDRMKTTLALSCHAVQEGCLSCCANCYLCCFLDRDGFCSQQNRARYLGTCNSLNLGVLWNGVKNTYNRWPASTILTLLIFIFFFSYLIFVRVSPPGSDQDALVSEINRTLALGGFLLVLLMLAIAGLIVTCGHEILNLYSFAAPSTGTDIRNDDSVVFIEEEGENEILQ